MNEDTKQQEQKGNGVLPCVSVSLLATLLKYAVDETGRISGDHDGNAGILMTTDSYEKIASDFIASLQ